MKSDMYYIKRGSTTQQPLKDQVLRGQSYSKSYLFNYNVKLFVSMVNL